MSNTLVVCRNKAIANRLYRRTLLYLRRHDRPTSMNMGAYSVTDNGSNDTIRFATLEEIDKKHIDDGFHAIRMTDDVYEDWLDQVEIMNRNKEVENHE